jgi:CheY-like chemotaxis protein
MLNVLLAQYGAEVMTVASANDAFDALSQWKPDLLLCDIGMPHEDGYSLIARIRALEATEGGAVPAIALTGYVRVEERMRALMAGYQMFVPKPVEADELASIIASLVGRADNDVVADSRA